MGFVRWHRRLKERAHTHTRFYPCYTLSGLVDVSHHSPNCTRGCISSSGCRLYGNDSFCSSFCPPLARLSFGCSFFFVYVVCGKYENQCNNQIPSGEQPRWRDVVASEWKKQQRKQIYPHPKCWMVIHISCRCSFSPYIHLVFFFHVSRPLLTVFGALFSYSVIGILS